ncbi:MAG: hypothetical protein ACQEXV_14785 [Bacillota bacterium]
MANRDQVNERYYGQINSEESHEATRNGIHWICRHVQGQGTLVLSVPYGYHPFHDHKRTYYAGSLSRVLYPYFDEQALEVHHKYLCFAGRKKSKELREAKPGAEHLARWMALDEEQFRLVEQRSQNESAQGSARQGGTANPAYGGTGIASGEDCTS